MTHHDTSTDRDREAKSDNQCAIEAVAKALREEREEYWRDPYEPRVTLADDAYACAAIRALRRLGWSAPYDEPTEAMVEAAMAAHDDTPDNQGYYPTSGSYNAIRAALVAAAKARGK